MTERKGHYFEVCIALDSSEFSEIFTSEIMDFCGEAVEIEGNKIIVRTSKDKDFINALLAHLSDLGANLKAIWQKSISFSHNIEKKQNRDWIEEYKKGIKPIRCGRFYICPPWDNSNDLSLRGESIDSPKQSKSSRHTEHSEVSKTRDLKRQNKSRTEKRINELDSPLQQNDSNNLTPCDLDSSLCATRFAQNDEFNINCFDLQSESHNDKLINITLEPSLAFGTGHHSSTFMCIQAIESLCENGNLKNKTLLDFGCGSGILALCAYKLGAKVDLCDIDELAIAESKKNFRNNNATISRIWNGTIRRESNPKYDIITANIIASVLIEQKENIASALKCGGIAILSGILDIYKDEVLARFSDFEVLNIAQKDEWICIMLRKF